MELEITGNSKIITEFKLAASSCSMVQLYLLFVYTTYSFKDHVFNLVDVLFSNNLHI